jgi:cytoskeleton protein RodZ
LSVAEVASCLHLPVRTIEQIELGQLSAIGLTYRRGYVASYARLLGLEPEPLLVALGPAESEPLRPVLPVRRSGQHWGRIMNFATYALVSGAIVAPLVYFFVLGGARLFESELAGSARSGTEATAPTESAVPGYRERIAGVLSLDETGVESTEGLHLSASALPLTAMRPATEVPTRPESAPALAPEPAVPADPMSTLRLELAGDSWIEVMDARGERLEFDLLRAGTDREYAGHPPFNLLLGRANVVSIHLDGEPVQFSGGDRAGIAETVIDHPRADPPAPVPEQD